MPADDPPRFVGPLDGLRPAFGAGEHQAQVVGRQRGIRMRVALSGQANLQSLLVQFAGSGKVALSAKSAGQIVQCSCRVQMLHTEDLLADGKNLLVVLLGSCIILLALTDAAQAVEGIGGQQVTLAVGLAADRQSFFQAFLGSLEILLSLELQSQVVESAPCFRVHGPQCLALDRERLPVIQQRHRRIVHFGIQGAQPIQRGGGQGVLFAQRFTLQGQHFLI